jgi:hypothetical protein
MREVKRRPSNPRLQRTLAPNPRLQRTRMRASLSRKPLGGTGRHSKEV